MTTMKLERNTMKNECGWEIIISTVYFVDEEVYETMVMTADDFDEVECHRTRSFRTAMAIHDNMVAKYRKLGFVVA